MTDKLSREDVLKIAGACGIVLSDSPCVISQAIERFAAAMYAAGAAAEREVSDKLERALENALRLMRYSSYHPCKTEPMGVMVATLAEVAALRATREKAD